VDDLTDLVEEEVMVAVEVVIEDTVAVEVEETIEDSEAVDTVEVIVMEAVEEEVAAAMDTEAISQRTANGKTTAEAAPRGI